MPFKGRKNFVSIAGFIFGLSLVLSVILPWLHALLPFVEWIVFLIGLLLFVVIGKYMGVFEE
jgi:hypothetical protein